MEEYVPLILQLLSGALGGNVAGKLLKNMSLGTLGNSIVGILGGNLGGQILGMLDPDIATGTTAMSTAGIIGSIASGGVGGGIFMAIIGMIKKVMTK